MNNFSKNALGWSEKPGSEPNWCHHKVDLSDCSEEYRKAYYDGWNNCNMQHSQCEAESNDKDERIRKALLNDFKENCSEYYCEGVNRDMIIAWLEKQRKSSKEENAALPDVPVDERIRDSIALVLTDVDEQVLLNRALTLKAALEWLEKQGKRDARYKYLEELPEADTIYQMAMNDAMVEEAKTKAIEAISNMDIFELLGLEKQGEQKTAVYDHKFHVGDIVKSKSRPMLDARKIISIDKDCYWCEDKGCLGFAWEDDYDLVEQKPTDKAEPKFKVGDWVVKQDGESFWNGDCVAQITNITDCGEHWLNTGCWVEARDIRLWTINDAKDGDVLCYENKNSFKIFIYKNGHIHYHCCYSNGYLNPVDSFFVLQKHLLCYIQPATKEQCDLLFSKIRESGHEWDDGKKELKKIEVASKENEDDRIRRGIIRNLQFLMDRSEGFVKEDLAERIAWLEKQGKNVQPDIPEDGQILNSLTDVDKRAFLDRPVTLRAAIDWLSKQCKQECSVCSKILNNGETMNEKDIEELKKWLCDRGYYVGNSEVAKSLRKLADEFDD